MTNMKTYDTKPFTIAGMYLDALVVISWAHLTPVPPALMVRIAWKWGM